MNKSVPVDELAEAVAKTLNGYNEHVVSETKAKAKDCMRRLVDKTKETAPKRRPRYYKQISSKVTREDKFATEYTWYVKGSEARLSHLLENGHAKKGGGRVEGTRFIKNASEPIIEEFEKAVEEIIKNG